MDSGFVEVDDVKIPYWIEGNGIPCIVTGDPSYEKKVLSKELRKHFTFIFMEPRLLVPKEKPLSLTMKDVVSDIELVRQTTGLDQVVLLGHSMCGWFALEYARSHPDYSTHTVMIGTPPHFKVEQWRATRDEYWENNASTERKRIYEEKKKNFEDMKDNLTYSERIAQDYVSDDPVRWYDLEFDSTWLWANYRYDSEGMWNFLNIEMPRYQILDGDLDLSIFLALGLHDYIVPPSMWDEYKGEFTNLTSHLFEKSGHTPQFEEQELFDKLLIEWVKTH